MSVLLLAALAIPGGLAAFLTFRRPRVSLGIGALTAVFAVVAASAIGPQDTVPLAGTVVAGSSGLRLIAFAWAAGIALIGLADVLVGTGGLSLGPSLIGLGAGVLGLSVADAGIGVALLTAGGVATALGPMAWARDHGPDGAATGLRYLRPLALAGLLGLGAVAWGASPVGPFATVDPGTVDPGLQTGIGLALLVIVAAVVIRLGAIPAHVWAARYAESAPIAAVPATLGWGAAGFAIVGLGWLEVTIEPAAAPLLVEHGLIAFVAAASVLLGGLAAILHDDLEHILGYSIVQDAGIALLAFAIAGREGSAPGRDWLIGMVAVKSGLAAWILVTRSAFGVRNLSELRGWARSSPLLGVALVLVIVGAVGLPGMATFAARGTLTATGLATPFDAFVLLAAFAPLLYLGRIGLVGLDRMSDAVRAGRATRPRVRSVRPEGWTGGDAKDVVRLVPVALEANRYAIAAVAAVLVAAIGLGVATVGVGTSSVDPSLGEPGASFPAEPLESGL